MTRRFLPPLLLPVLLLLAVAVPAARAGDAPALGDAVARALASPDPAERLGHCLAVLALRPDPAAVAAAVPGAWRWPSDAPRGETVEWEHVTPDGVPHTVYAYAPKAYTPERAWPLFVWMHGGVSQPQDGKGEGAIDDFKEAAEREGFLILSPSTQPEALWWTPMGAAYLRAALDTMRRRWRVDPDRVLAAGFSDGGSAGYHLLAHDPTPYAAFLAYVGNPLVTRIYGGPTWSTNLASRPVYAVNGGRDPLYPSEQMQPFVEAMQAAGARISWFAEPTEAHDGSSFPARLPSILAFWKENPRSALPRRLAWATSRPGLDGEGRFAWAEILAVDEAAPSAEGLAAPVELPLPDVTPRPRLGIVLDQEFEGPGIRVREVQPGTPAEEAGFQPGDVIVELGGDAVPGDEPLAALRAYLESLEGKDGVFTVRREGARVEIRARPRVLAEDRPARPAELGYDRPVGLLEVEAKDGNRIEVRTRSVRSLRLFLAEPLVDFSKELVVVVNGTERFRGKPPQDAALTLAEAVRGGPGAPVFRGAITLEVPPR